MVLSANLKAGLPAATLGETLLDGSSQGTGSEEQGKFERVWVLSRFSGSGLRIEIETEFTEKLQSIIGSAYVACFCLASAVEEFHSKRQGLKHIAVSSVGCTSCVGICCWSRC